MGRFGERSAFRLFLDDEGGYTTVAVALALLVSICLVFALASVEWTQSRSADVQTVADATALAGANVVSAYATVATVLDACVLSLGLAGVLIMGVGLVVSAIPGLSAVGASAMELGGDVLDSRQRFATSAMAGLRRLESGLPYAVVVNSARCVATNSTGEAGLTGVAIPFPLESESDWSSLADEIDSSDMDASAERLQEASDRVKRATDAADAARLAGWLADCGDEPRSLQERASTLAGLGAGENPDYASVDGWNFGVALSRARAYYAARLAGESAEGSGVEALTDSACRGAFYSYALGEVRAGSYVEHEDGSVDVDLPSLPHDSTSVRATALFTDASWPCTVEDGSATLHSTLSCPGATGEAVGSASLATLEAGGVSHCPVCRMDVGDMGKVAAASTSIDNGFEHFWRRVVEASKDYERARDEQAEAERVLAQVAEEVGDAFDRAIEALSVPRPKLCPPGAWGCVAVVGRGEGASVPAELTDAFLTPSDLPGGVAVSAATLAPDPTAAENDVLSRLFDGLVERGGQSGGIPGALDTVTSVWGRLLVSYGSAYESVSGVADDLLSGIDGVFGTKVGSWLRARLSDAVSAMGFEPADMRLRKPVLCNTQDVLGKAGAGGLASVRSLIESIPAGGTPAEVARALGHEVLDEYGETTITIAEIPIPGTGMSVPLTIDLSSLGGAA
ncbi:MAG: hypothetical protein LKI25_08510 [Atopobiaceae bacterium]|nr:hypothetical protein [Atopobiaceae bacterium]MCI2174229.1 hypothetical protein [Atopobiaceae bacterium]MCI2206870.1 hypothetical protein [Atopobiaceae bacterium]